MRRLKLIFVHTPKSGGTSISAAVTEFFSHDLVLADYGDRPNDPISPMNIDPYGFLDRCRQQNALTLANKAAVIGHFWVAKYEGIAADIRATDSNPHLYTNSADTRTADGDAHVHARATDTRATNAYVHANPTDSGATNGCSTYGGPANPGTVHRYAHGANPA